MSHFTAVYDACVLYPAPLRDLLMHLAMSNLFRAKWSGEIHEEWIRNVLKERPDLTREKLHRTRQNMDKHVDGLVTGYESLIPGLTLPDDNDRHVLAAAIRARADVIVTFNLKDFPAEYLSQFDIEAQHPDDFVFHLTDLNPEAVCEAAKRQRASLKSPPSVRRGLSRNHGTTAVTENGSVPQATAGVCLSKPKSTKLQCVCFGS